MAKTKFGQLIAQPKVVFIFLTRLTAGPEGYGFLTELEAKGYSTYKVYIEDNIELAQALRITDTPAFIVYHEGQIFFKISSPIEFGMEDFGKFVNKKL